MMMITIKRSLHVLTLTSTGWLTMVAQQKLPETTKERVQQGVTSVVETMQGTVEYVEGNHLVVRMSGGDIREFDPPPNRKFVIDGKDRKTGDLKPGTKLTANVTTTTTSVIERTK